MSIRIAAVAIGVGFSLAACSEEAGYKIEPDAVYFQYETGRMERVAGADASTFEQLTNEYGRDKNSIYRLSDALPDAFIGQYDPGHPKPDPAGGTIYSSDWRGVLVCDYRTYRDIGLDRQIDRYCAYDGGIRVPGADPQSFQPLTPVLAKDKEHVYVFRDVLTGADPETFEPNCKNSFVSGRDKYGCYWFAHRVPCDCKPHAGAEFAAPIAEMPPGMALLAHTPPISVDTRVLADQPRFDSVFHRMSAGYWRLSPGHHTLPLKCWNGEESERLSVPVDIEVGGLYRLMQQEDVPCGVEVTRPAMILGQSQKPEIQVEKPDNSGERASQLELTPGPHQLVAVCRYATRSEFRESRAPVNVELDRGQIYKLVGTFDLATNVCEVRAVSVQTLRRAQNVHRPR